MAIIFCAGNTAGGPNPMCKSEFQDRTYGSQRRAHTKCDKKLGDQFVYRCTVCGKEKTKR